jgi:hypothetical protein
VRPAHALVHREIHAQCGRLTWLEGRRTDDRAGWSTALNQLDLWLAQDLQRLVPIVA